MSWAADKIGGEIVGLQMGKHGLPPIGIVTQHGLTHKWWFIPQDGGGTDPIGPFETEIEAELVRNDRSLNLEKFSANVFDFDEADQQIRSIWKLEAGRGKRNMTLGYLGAKMKAEDRWSQHGFADEAAYRDAVGVSTGVWGRYVRIAGCFQYLDMDRFCRMTAENAEQLGSLAEELRYDPDWLENAIKLQAEEFRKLVMIAKAEAAGVEVQDMRVKFSLPLFEAQRRVIKEGIADFMLEHSINDEGTALEWLVMGYSKRKTFARFIQEQLPELRKGLSADVPALALGNHIRALGEMLENLKGEQ